MFGLRWDPTYRVMRQRRFRMRELRYANRPYRKTGAWGRKLVWEKVPEPDYGILWESVGDPRRGGVVVFVSERARAFAIEALRSWGAKYIVPFADVNGAGLTWAPEVGR